MPDAADVDRAVAAARAAFETGPWPTCCRRRREALMWKLADLIEKNAEELAELESLDNGKTQVHGQHHRCSGHAAITSATWPAGPPRSKARPSRPRSADAGREVPYLYAARAGRRGRADRALEFPAGHGGVEARPGAGRGLHLRAEARRADAALGAAPGRADHARPGFRPAWSTFSPATAKPRARRWSRIPGSTRSPSPARPRSARSSTSQRTGYAQARVAGARRQVAGDRAAGCGSRTP